MGKGGCFRFGVAGLPALLKVSCRRSVAREFTRSHFWVIRVSAKGNAMDIFGPLVSRLFRASLVIFVAVFCISTRAQTNFWTNSTSGNWEDANWSLGVLPGTNQSVVIGNHGWKAVAIGPDTAQNFPQTMIIDSLSLTSPGTDTVNTVLLNYAGFQTPFVTGPVYVGTNTALVVLQSALHATNGTMTVDGTVIQGAMSQVRAGLTIGSEGVYDLTNGTLNGGFEYLSGRFHQDGGSNYCLYLGDYGGEYELLGGDFVASDFYGSEIHGSFIQSGGTMSSYMAVGRSGIASGYYELDGGIMRCPYLQVPGPASGSASDSSLMLQTGGTNIAGTITIGVDSVQYEYMPMGLGSYKLTNGMLVASNVTISGRGSFLQTGGMHSNTSLAITQSEYFDWEQPGMPSYYYFAPGHYSLNGGAFISDLVNLEPGAFSQSGGSSQITTLEMSGDQYILSDNRYSLSGGSYALSGGDLSVSNMSASSGGNFIQTGGTVRQTGILTLAGGGLTAGSGAQQFGLLQLSTSGNTNFTNSIITLSPGPCAIRFANSSAMVWSNEPVLFITNWNGSLSGGGLQQIFFGNDASGLTAQQLAQIEFQNPAGVSPGLYPAVILPNGEIIPDPNSTASNVLPPQMSLAVRADGAMQVQLHGAAGRSYAIEVSSNLVDWTPWTNQFNTNGTFTLPDDNATNCPQRFYRAMLRP